MTITREELWEKYGQGERLEDLIPGQVVTFAHDTHEAAIAYAKANLEHYGHPSVIERDNGRWLVHIDLRSALENFQH